MPGHARRHNQSLHLWTCGQRKGVAHMSTGASSAEAHRFSAHYNSDGAYTPDDTLPSRRSVPGHALARNENEADRSQATKTGHVDELATVTEPGPVPGQEDRQSRRLFTLDGLDVHVWAPLEPHYNAEANRNLAGQSIWGAE
jgi:hypothetical protein